MRIVQINTVPNLSTGTVMLENHKRYVAEGHESWRMWGRGREAENEFEFKFGNDLGVKIDVLETRLLGKAGFHSKAATKRLLAKLDEIKPDLVHLHNIHGYYLNVEMLFEWLAKSDCAVEWTLHDCWAFTGHCAYFSYIDCDQWKSDDGCGATCPQYHTYPKTIHPYSCRTSFIAKKCAFTSVASDRLRIIVPSEWLADLVCESFLAKYPISVMKNSVDTSVFSYVESDFRKKYGLSDKFIVLGVASPWTERKGYAEFVDLSANLDSDCAIVLVGLSEKQLSECPKGIVGIPKTTSQRELAEIYSAADVLYQPSVEETFGMTVLEAQLCGTSVIVKRGSACVEAVLDWSNAYAVANCDEAKAVIAAMKSNVSRDGVATELEG